MDISFFVLTGSGRPTRGEWTVRSKGKSWLSMVQYIICVCVRVSVCVLTSHPLPLQTTWIRRDTTFFSLSLLAQGDSSWCTMVLKKLAPSFSAHSAPTLNTVIRSLTLQPSCWHPLSYLPHFTPLQSGSRPHGSPLWLRGLLDLSLDTGLQCCRWIEW